MKRLLDILFAITHPKFWPSNESSSPHYDRLVNKWIEEGARVEFVGEYLVIVDSHKVWVSNYPFQYGYLYGKSRALPYRRTRKKLRDFIERKQFDI